MLRTLLAGSVACLMLGTSAAQADFWGRWDRVGGGWTTGWIRHSGNANVCGHYAAGCSCFGRNYCGNYANGAVTTWWPYGCGNPAVWQVRCTIQPIADSSAECRSYSAMAVQQHGENLRRRCGYTGGRWHSDYQTHYNWCVRVSTAFRASETQARVAGLAQCGGAQRGAIAILSAYYGLNCPQTDSGRTKNVSPHVAQTCNGRGQCTYQVNHQVIGDPAYGCQKDFRIQYRCDSATKQAYVQPEASGRPAYLSCP